MRNLKKSGTLKVEVAEYEPEGILNFEKRVLRFESYCIPIASQWEMHFKRLPYK